MVPSVFKSIAASLYPKGETALHDEWGSWLAQAQLKVIFTPNPEQIVLAQQDPNFAKLLLQADTLLPDGTGLLIATKLLYPQKSRGMTRITGTDLLHWWLGQGGKREVKTFLLGGKTGVANRLARRVDPTGQWCKGIHGYSSVRKPSGEEDRLVLDELRQSAPQVLWVAFGAPYQEQWVAQHKEFLQKNGVKIVVVCGGAFDYLVGDVTRAPKIIRRLGLEWLYRLILEPWRWKRQLRLPMFILLVLHEAVKKLNPQVR